MKAQISKLKSQNHNSKLKNKSDLVKTFFRFALCILVLTFAFCTLRLSALALTMSNSNYSIDMGNFNMASGVTSNSNEKLGFTVGQTAPGLFSGPNYLVKSGFQYINVASASSSIVFTFSIDQTTIDFGTISATDPVTRTNKLSVSSGATNGYSITAVENQPLTDSSSHEIIPDTTCDNGSCSESLSAPWANTLTYGFGYRCDNEEASDCATGFSDSTFYKQFSDSLKKETPQIIMSSVKSSLSAKAKITYKVNVSGMQAAGVYGNVITYIATPTF
ncbi:MAG: hypothetical protein ABIC96_04120 [Patescibacteria group bacterium]